MTDPPDPASVPVLVAIPLAGRVLPPPPGRAVGAFPLRAIEGGRSVDAAGRSASDLTLLVIDPRSLTRDCLVAALATADGIGRVYAAANVVEAVAGLDRTIPIDVALINLAADAFGDAELGEIRETLRSPASIDAIVLLTSFIDVAHAQIALKQGFHAYLRSDTPFDQTLEAIRFVSLGWMVYPAMDPAFLFSVRSSPPPSDAVAQATNFGLTPRQRQVLDGLQQGMTNRAIAVSLSVSERTVKAHVQELMRKLGASNRTQVAMIARGAR